MKSQPEKFQRREYFRYPCLLDFKYYELTAEQAMLDSVDAIFSEIRDEHFYEKERKGKIMDLSGGGIRFTTDSQKIYAISSPVKELQADAVYRVVCGYEPTGD